MLNEIMTKNETIKETTSRDGKHMSSVHGRYLLALNFVSTIYDIDLDMSPCSYLPLEANASYKNPAYEAIRNAYKNPLAVTNSVYTNPDLGEYNLSNYTEIDAELVGCSYWNSTDGSNYNKRLSNVSGSSNCYVSTKRFTSSDLPIGSLVVIDEAFGVRPEAWVSDSQLILIMVILNLVLTVSFTTKILITVLKCMTNSPLLTQLISLEDH